MISSQVIRGQEEQIDLKQKLKIALMQADKRNVEFEVAATTSNTYANIPVNACLCNTNIGNNDGDNEKGDGDKPQSSQTGQPPTWQLTKKQAKQSP